LTSQGRGLRIGRTFPVQRIPSEREVTRVQRCKAGLAVAVLILGFSITGQPVCEEAPGGAAGPVKAGVGRAQAGSLEGNVNAEEYILGPGDVLAIGFWGDVNRSEQVVVNPDGDALVPPVGPLALTGLSLGEARKLISERLSAYYRPGILSVSLVSIRSFQVHVVGMVETPGALEANAVTRVSQAIALAGGLADLASDRNIRLLRQNDTLRVDLERYLLVGDNRVNPFLNDGDVVYVPPRSEMVKVSGSVYRESSYEFTEGESLGELLQLAGGLRPDALVDSLELVRFKTDDPTASETFVIGADPATLEHFRMAPGDRVFVRSIADWHRDAQVVIVGEVVHPGTYVIAEGSETLSELLGRAGGLTERASLAEARLVRGVYASRAYPIEASMDSLVFTGGQVSDKQVGLAQTLVREPKGAVSLDFDRLYDVKGKRSDPPLYDGDVISIPRGSMSVRVSGQVKRPGLVSFKAGEGASYYINQAGGFASGSDRWGVEVVTAQSGQMLKASGATVRPGDIVWVPRKKDLGVWTTVRDVIQVLAQMATIYIVIDQITAE